MKVIEIFRSIEGEGRRMGKTAIFLRLHDCSLRCSFCDTPYSYDTGDFRVMTPEQVAESIKSMGGANLRRLTVTGGEPLLHKDELPALLDLLPDWDVNFETNGSIAILSALPEKYLSGNRVWFTLDYKSPSSGMEGQMEPLNFCHLRKQDVLKFVVADQNDMEVAKRVISNMTFENPYPHIYFSPVWGRIDLKDIVHFIQFNDLNNVAVQVQLHKIIWNPDTRGV